VPPQFWKFTKECKVVMRILTYFRVHMFTPMVDTNVMFLILMVADVHFGYVSPFLHYTNINLLALHNLLMDMFGCSTNISIRIGVSWYRFLCSYLSAFSSIIGNFRSVPYLQLAEYSVKLYHYKFNYQVHAHTHTYFRQDW
jgi:hypothetical protein